MLIPSRKQLTIIIMKKEKKKITDKEKIDRKQKAIKIVKRIFHVLGYVSIVAWGLLGLLYACGVSKQRQEANNVVEKQPNRAYNPNRPYSANIVTTPTDISISDIYGGVYGTPEITPYRALMDFTYVRDYSYVGTTANPNRFICPNAISSYSFINTVFKDEYGDFKNARTFSFDIFDKDGHYPVINGQRVDYIDIECTSPTACNWTLYSTNISTNVQGSNVVLVMNLANSELPYHYNQHSRTIIFTELFSGKYFFAKGVNYNPTDYYSGSQYQRFIYAMSQFSIHNLSLSFKDDIDFSLITRYFNSFISTSNVYNGLVLNSFTVSTYSLEGNFYVLEGDFYFNSVYYNQLRFYYSYRTFTDGAQGYEDLGITVNGNLIGNFSNSNAYGLLYLSDISLANTISDNVIQIAYPAVYNWASHNINIKTGLNLFSGNLIVKAIVPSYIYGSDYGGYSNTDIDAQYNYSKILNVFNVYNNFNFSLVNGEPYIQIYTEGDNGISNYTGTLIDVFNIINIGFGGLTNLFNYALLPGITLGALFAIPVTLTILLFVIKLFKR